MQHNYLSLLPPPIQSIVAEVEHKCGRELLVHRNADIHLAGGFVLSAPVVGRVEFRIETKHEAIEPSVLAHETLHAYRYLVEGVPMLSFTQPPVKWSGENLSNDYLFSDWSIDNAIEHLIIVPLQARLGIPLRDQGETVLERHFRDYATWEWPKPAKRMVCILGHLWAMSSGRPSFESAVQRALQKDNLGKITAELDQRLRRAIRCKEGMIGHLCHAAGIPQEIVHLRYFDMKDSTVREFSYPPRMVVDEAAGTVSCQYKTLGTFVRPLAKGNN